MKTEQVLSYVPVDATAMKTLVTEVKETLASDVDITTAEKSSITTVALWNISKSKKSASRAFAQRRNDIRFI